MSVNTNKYLSISFLLIILPLVGFSQDLFDYSNTLLYANHLMRTKQYEFSIPEWERLVFINPTNDSLKQNLLISYIKSGKPRMAIQRMESFYSNIDSMPHAMAGFYFRSLILNNDYGKARDFISLYDHFTEEEKIKNRIITGLLSDLWDEAYRLYDSGSGKFPSSMKEFESVIAESKKIERKSPLVAGMLSAVVPASGKFYTGDWKDGLTGLILTSGFAFQSIRGFNKKGVSSGIGWIFGTASLAFYVGNIYGSVKSARLFNHHQRKRIYDSIENTFVSSF